MNKQTNKSTIEICKQKIERLIQITTMDTKQNSDLILSLVIEN